MKLVDEKGRIFGVINIIDLCILVIVVLIVGLVGSKMLGKNIGPAGSANKDVIVEVKCTLAPQAEADALHKGDKMVSGTSFVDATIQSVTSVPADFGVPTSDGRMVLTKHPLLKDIYVTFKMSGDEKAAILKLGSQEIRIGGKYTLKTSTVEIDGTVDKITFVK
jgi:hypothetical protein